ncbi:MAG: phytanoyl-CoA dioxygenase family protein [Armatimonadota bacterium]|nr:phytanoyl-CoA dioxygenase family protein [Armatimonadota bacterium]
MQLSHAQKKQLFGAGYVKLPGVVPQAMVNGALRAINHSVGNGMNVEDMTRFRAQTYCPELRGTPVISGLFNDTPARSLAESAIGAGKLRPVTGGQIALRFPTNQDPPSKPGPHIDGMYSATNGVAEGTIQNFTALVGVLLSDLPEEGAGNFTVWPGTHHLLESHFREHTPQSLLAGMPKIDFPPPTPITGKAGDIVLCHYQLCHGIMPNVSPHVRYAIFFRLSHVDHEQHKWDSMTDIWLEWEGMQEFAADR